MKIQLNDHDPIHLNPVPLTVMLAGFLVILAAGMAIAFQRDWTAAPWWMFAAGVAGVIAFGIGARYAVADKAAEERAEGIGA